MTEDKAKLYFDAMNEGWQLVKKYREITQDDLKAWTQFVCDESAFSKKYVNPASAPYERFMRNLGVAIIEAVEDISIENTKQKDNEEYEIDSDRFIDYFGDGVVR